jgi:hypothetical protein
VKGRLVPRRLPAVGCAGHRGAAPPRKPAAQCATHCCRVLLHGISPEALKHVLPPHCRSCTRHTALSPLGQRGPRAQRGRAPTGSRPPAIKPPALPTLVCAHVSSPACNRVDNAAGAACLSGGRRTGNGTAGAGHSIPGCRPLLWRWVKVSAACPLTRAARTSAAIRVAYARSSMSASWAHTHGWIPAASPRRMCLGQGPRPWGHCALVPRPAQGALETVDFDR